MTRQRLAKIVLEITAIAVVGSLIASVLYTSIRAGLWIGWPVFMLLAVLWLGAAIWAVRNQ